VWRQVECYRDWPGPTGRGPHSAVTLASSVREPNDYPERGLWLEAHMPQGRGVVPLWLLSTTLWLSASAAPKTLRRAHFDECSECASCAPGKQRAGAGPLPTSQVLLPKCDVCTGCTASLEYEPPSCCFDRSSTCSDSVGATQRA
jgi:hypothetical protein